MHGRGHADIQLWEGGRGDRCRAGIPGGCGGQRLCRRRTERAEFYVKDAAEKTLTTSTTADAEIAEHPVLGKKFSIKFNFFGVPLQFTATGFECAGCKVENKETTEKAGAAAAGTGRLKFTGVTADEPAGCVISNTKGEKNVLESLTVNFHADFTAGGKGFIHFVPTAGEGGVFFQLRLEGGSCAAIAGTYNIIGTLAAEGTNKTGVFALGQGMVFNPAVQIGVPLKTAFEITGTSTFSLTKEAGKKVEFTVKP